MANHRGMSKSRQSGGFRRPAPAAGMAVKRLIILMPRSLRSAGSGTRRRMNVRRKRGAAIGLAALGMALAGCGASHPQSETLTVLDLGPGETAPDPALTDFGYPESAIFRTLYIHDQHIG